MDDATGLASGSGEGFGGVAERLEKFAQQQRGEMERIIKKCVDDAMRKHNVAMKSHLSQVLNFIQRSITISNHHSKVFPQFRNVHQGSDVVLVATGPTAKDYKCMEGAVHIGVNRAFQLETVDLRYLFMHDYKAVKKYIKEASLYKPESCTKFYGGTIPAGERLEANALYYHVATANVCMIGTLKEKKKKCRFCYNLDTEAFHAFGSVVFAAMPFALWTNPRTIYLVGCDCSSGYFDESFPSAFPSKQSQRLIRSWLSLKEFASLYYPDTKILSINPVGLKGVFEEYVQT